MARRRNEGNGCRSIITAALTTLVIGVVFLISAVTGIDFSGLLGLSTAVPGQNVTQVASGPSGAVRSIAVGQGFGSEKGFWQVYFTAPSGSSDFATYSNGIDAPLAAAIGGAQRTLDIAAFEWNNPAIHQAVLAAQRRGVRVRMVADNEHTIEDEDSLLRELVSAGMPVIYDNRSPFMHNKFMIIDSSSVWTGSTNYTINDVYRNNNNMLLLRSQRTVEVYQTEFNQMFDGRKFGPNKTVNTASFQQDGTAVEIYFAPKAQVLAAIQKEIAAAESNVRFMAFSFTLDALAGTLLDRAEDGITVEGVFETRGSETAYSELRPLRCAGLNMRQDGNRYTMHHKVFIVDDDTVITGSFNFSDNAISSNDENLVIIRDRDLAKQYIDEFNRVMSQAIAPNCNDL